MNLESEAEAARLVDSIIEAPSVRQKCLDIFADSIAEANSNSREKWAVTCKKGKVRLQVGHVIICTLEGGRIWMSLDKTLLESSDKQPIFESSPDWNWDETDYPEYSSIGSKNGYYLPSDRHDEMWPSMRRLHFEAIYRAANGRAMDRRTPESHSSGILKYLRNTLERHVPDPLYSS